MKEKSLHYTAMPGILIFLWFFISQSSLVPEVLLPSPFKVFHYLGVNFYSELLGVTFYTVQLWILSFLTGAVFGIMMGLIIGYYQTIYAYLEVVIDFFRSLPVVVMLPVVVIFLGIGWISKFVIISFFTALYILVNTIYGVRYGKTSKIILTNILKMTPVQKLIKVIIPSALPSIFMGLRTTISLSLIVAIAAEMLIGGPGGLGRKIMDDMLVYNMTEMYSIILVIGLLGYFSNKLFYLIESRIIHWKGY